LVSTDRPMNKSTGSRPLYLIGAFCAAFAVSWLAVVAVFFSFTSPKVPSHAGQSNREDAFDDAVAVTRSGSVLTVGHHQLLNPTGSDFMLFVWLKLKGALNVEERSAFLGKYDTRGDNPEGYALALVGGADGIRPHVYWQNSAGRGRWFAFASTTIEPGRWYVMGVTFRAQRYLGVHIAPYGPEANAEVLGGYDLDGTIIPASNANLSIGAFKKSKFRGHVGPFGIFRDIDISKDATRILKRIARNPSFESEPVEESQIALWADPGVDRGPLHVPITEDGDSDATASGKAAQATSNGEVATVRSSH
jgi:hypothetical protein